MRINPLVGALTAWTLAAFPAVADTEFKPKQLRRHVEYLASDAMGGRDTGEPGIIEAESYIVRGFREAGLKPLPGAPDYYMEVTLYRRGYDPDQTSLSTRGKDGGSVALLGRDFRPFPFSDEGEMEAPVVFAGYGITAPESEWDDYAGLDVEGKWVLVLRHTPGEDDPDSPFAGAGNRHGLFATKARNASEQGARGMLLVTDPLHHTGGDDFRVGGALRLDPPSSAPSSSSGDGPFLALHVSQQVARAMAAEAGRDLLEMQRAVDAGTAPSELGLGKLRARASVRAATRVEEVRARNIVGFLEGSDPELRDEWIVIGGHHDHVGSYQGPGDTIFNGADDNASGTTGVMELARAFGSLENPPRRSLVFATFTAEEKGLLGSRAMVEQRKIPVERVRFMLNLDMIGRNPETPVEVFGDGYVQGLKEIVDDANAGVGLDLRYGGASYAGNSDHDAFYSEDIPFMFFFTGIHQDYHQVGDHARKLSYDRMAEILEVAYGVVGRIADTDRAPGFVHRIGWLGARVEVEERGGKSEAVVTAVEEDSRGSRAGLASGDILVAFDDTPLEDPSTVGSAFRAIDPGTEVALTIRRGASSSEVAVQRARVGYMGVFPQPLDEDTRKRFGLGDDEGFGLRQVTPDGPADQAGLQAGDVVIRIAGRPVGLSNLRSHLTRIGAGETVEFTVIRDGERQVLPVTLGERPGRP